MVGVFRNALGAPWGCWWGRWRWERPKRLSIDLFEHDEGVDGGNEGRAAKAAGFVVAVVSDDDDNRRRFCRRRLSAAA